MTHTYAFITPSSFQGQNSIQHNGETKKDPLSSPTFNSNPLMKKEKFIEKKMASLTIIIPAFNEERNIVTTIHKSLEVGNAIAQSLKILVVDDGSTDETGRICKKFEKKFSEVRMIQHVKNEGYGAALRSGFQHQSSEWIWIIDADLQFDLHQISDFLPWIHPNHVICGYRNRRADGFTRFVAGKTWTALANLILGTQINDLDCAFKIFPSRVLQDFKLKSNFATVSIEIIQAAIFHEMKIVQVPVRHFPRSHGEQSGLNPKVVFKSCTELFKLAFLKIP